MAEQEKKGRAWQVKPGRQAVAKREGVRRGNSATEKFGVWDLCLPFPPVTGLAPPPPFAWCVAPTHTPLIPSFVTSLGFFRRSSWRAGRPRASCESDPISKLLNFVVPCFAVVGSLQVAAWTDGRTDVWFGAVRW